DARAQVRDALHALLPYARAARVPLGIEPLHPLYAADRACVNTLAQANDLCDDLGDGTGVAVDTYHVWWDPDLEREIARAGKNILAYHVNDWLVPTTDLLLDRGMMGDGGIELRGTGAGGGRAGCRRHGEVELLAANKGWKRAPDEVLRICIGRHQAVVCCPRAAGWVRPPPRWGGGEGGGACNKAQSCA